MKGLPKFTKIVCSFLSLLFYSCQSNKPQLASESFGYERRPLENYYQMSNAQEFILPILPEWANFSQTGQCFKNFRTRYLNLKQIQGNFNFSYEEGIQLQLAFNKELAEVQANVKKDFVMVKDEEQIFLRKMQEIKSQVKVFIPPSYSRIHLIWVDQALRDPKVLNRFQNLMISEQMGEGHPILVSLCFSYKELEQFLINQGLEEMGTLVISSDFFSPFDKDFKAQPFFSLWFSQLFPGQRNFVFFSPQAEIPKEFQGEFSIKSY